MTYNLGFNPPSGKRADMGTIVHKVMEILAKLKEKVQQSPKIKKIQLQDDAIGNICININEFLTDNIINKLLNMSFDHYSNKSTHNKFTKKDREDCLQMCFDAVRYNDGQFDPRLRKIVAAEPHFDIPIDEDWAFYEYEVNGQKIKGQLAIKGTIDLVTETEEGIIEVIDWKTGRRLDWATGEEKTYDKLCADPQLLLYNYAISKLFPQYKQSIMSIFFIKDGGPFSMCFDESDQKKFIKMLKNKFLDIKNNNNPQPISQNRENWKCTKLCHYCKNNWPGTDQNMCIYIENSIKTKGIEQTIKDCTRSGFDIGFYSAPG
jgi:hypothetical protein